MVLQHWKSPRAWASEPEEASVSPSQHQAFMVGGKSQNSDLCEPNDISTDRTPEFTNSDFCGKNAHDDGGHQFGPSKTEVDESRLCLLDTACTSCMHSKKWREEYQKTLPNGIECAMTPSKKVFHFANGQSTEDRLSVWRIPIFLDGFKGEVYSAEVPNGSTPLLMSISAMTALDMVIFLKAHQVEVRQLNLTMPLLRTRTKHLGLDIAFNPDVGERTSSDVRQDRPRVQSEQEDLLVYYVDEARLALLHQQFLGGVKELQFSNMADERRPSLAERGVKAEDKRGTVSQRRSTELQAACRRIQVEDKRTWVALKRDYMVAEQVATDGFQNTVLFEPFAGSFGTTRVASGEFGWTCSQPLDLLDGYDLLSKAGQRLMWNVIQQHKPFLVLIAFDCRIWSLLTNCNPGTDWETLRDGLGRRTLLLIIKICKWQDQHGRYYLLENPAGSYAWVFDDLLAKLLEVAHGKYVIGDQCCYGKVDAETKKPVRKATGWLGNSEHVLNRVGRRCKCPWGTHQSVVGSNSSGLRSKQAAAYPRDLCRAICRGILDTMIFDYGWKFQHYDHAFPVFDDELDEVSDGYTPSVLEDDDDGDQWFVDDDGTLVRSHMIPRQRLFVPLQTDGTLPVRFEAIQKIRTTIMQAQDGTQRNHVDDWTQRRDEDTGLFWTGQTRFVLDHAAGPSVDVPEEMDVDDGVEEQPLSLVKQVKKPKAAPDRTLRRRRDRTRQLQRGFWREEREEEPMMLLKTALELVEAEGGGDWHRLDEQSPLFQEWKSSESASAEVVMVLMSRTARRLKKPQPFLGALEVPLRKSFILLKDSFLSTDWEQWTQMAPAAQIRPLIAKDRLLYVAVFGKELGAEIQGDEEDDRWRRLEEDRNRKWQALPRELKLAVKRIHVNLGHAGTAAMLRALRISKASEAALRAVRLFRCPDCPRIQNPKEPRPSKLPITDEFNVQIGMDIIHEKDSSGQGWSWLNIFCQGSQFQVCILLDSAGQPTSQQVIEAFGMGWTSWAGFPERGVVADRAKPFLSALAQEVADHGCTFSSAAKASPWQIGQIERHGGLWKETFRRVSWAHQVSGRQDVILTTAAVNQAKNSLTRKGGFSPAQWVLGRDVRLPASLADDQEVMRVGAQALAATPNSIFYRKTQLRMAAREAFARSSTSEALRRAELRQIRPSRGPFLPGMYVFYYDAADRDPSPNCWRGIARVIGKEGSSTIWISHKGILLAVSPEHLSRAYDPEVEHWSVVSGETELMDSMPAAGGTGFIDLRGSPTPPAIDDQVEAGKEGQLEAIADEPQVPPEAPESIALPEVEDLSSSSTSMARMQLESDREQKRSLKSYDFFDRQRKQRKSQSFPTTSKIKPEDIPIPEDDEFDPDKDDYHQARPMTTTMTRQLSPAEIDPAAEASEREAKRLRVSEPEDQASYAEGEVTFAYMATQVPKFLEEVATAHFTKHDLFYEEKEVSLQQFLFGMKRNDFTEKYEALAAMDANPQKKKGRKEIQLSELPAEQKKLFTEDGGSDQKEWLAWQSKEAVDILGLEESLKLRKQKPDLIVPSRWVRTNKNDGLVGKDFLAKSRLVVQGFKDKALGQYRRDAPTASQIAESVCLAVCAFYRYTLFAKDIKNAYFSGKSVGREVYIDPPRGGLLGIQPGQLLRARKAIYGFAEAARMFWLALREHLVSDGWQESKLEPALFYLRSGPSLQGILVTHVDDIEGGMSQEVWDRAFSKSSKALEFATNHVRDFIFRGREVKQSAEGHIDISMRNYALSMRKIPIGHDRRKQLEADLQPAEAELMNSSAGELGWLSRQLRCDLTYEKRCDPKMQVRSHCCRHAQVETVCWSGTPRS